MSILRWAGIEPPRDVVLDATVTPSSVDAVGDVARVYIPTFPATVVTIGDIDTNLTHVTGTALTTPAIVTALADIPAITLTNDSNADHVTVAAVATVPAVTISGGNNFTVAAVEVSAVAAVDHGSGFVLSGISHPGPIAVVADVGTVTTLSSTGASIVAATVSAVAGIPFGIETDVSYDPGPDTVATTAAVSAVQFAGGRDQLVSPAAVVLAADINGGDFLDPIYDTNQLPVTVDAVGIVPPIAIGGDALAQPLEVAAVGDVPAIIASQSVQITVVEVQAAAASDPTDFAGTILDVSAAPSSVDAVAGIPIPQTAGAQDAIVVVVSVDITTQMDGITLIGNGDAFFFPDTVPAFTAMGRSRGNGPGRSHSTVVRPRTVRATVRPHHSRSNVS